jgi:hypothetical protein
MRRFRTHFSWLVGFTAALMLAGFALWPARLALTVTDESSGRTVLIKPVRPGETFSIRFIHSVHRTPVEEQFRITAEREMVLERVVYETYGVGNPSGPGPGEVFRMENGKFMIAGINRHMTAIHQRIGQKTANHELVTDGQSMPLAAWSEPGSRVLLQVERVPLWRLWMPLKGGRRDES